MMSSLQRTSVSCLCTQFSLGIVLFLFVSLPQPLCSFPLLFLALFSYRSLFFHTNSLEREYCSVPPSHTTHKPYLQLLSVFQLSNTYRRKHREITTRREIDIKSSRRFAEESTGRGNVCACICAGNTCAGVRVRAYAQKCAG